ncbi:MAG: flagellar protein FlaG [Mobilitalea sp.]
MALDGLSGAMYHDSAKITQKPRSEVIVQEQSSMNINITEIPAITKIRNGNQFGSEQNQGQKENPTSEKQIKEAISKANNKLKGIRTRCEFSYHEETNRVSIKVLDKETQEIIREIPTEEALEMIEKMWEIAGLLVDEKR